MNDSTGFTAGLIAFVLVALVYVWASVALSALFRKAGEDGWQGWVPVLNIAVLISLGGFSPWLVFVSFIPILGQIAFLVILVIAYHRINRAFGHGTGMTVVAALFPLVWASILGFGSSRWIGAEAAGPRRLGEGWAGADAAVLPQGDLFPVFDRTGAPPVLRQPSSPPAVEGDASVSAAFWAPPSTTSQLSPPPASFLEQARGIGPREGESGRSDDLRDGAADPDDLDDSAVDPEDRVAPPPRFDGTFSPPPSSEPEARRRRSAPSAPIESVPLIARTPAADAGTPAPVAEVPVPPAVVKAPEPWAPAAVRTPAADPADPEHFPELSEAVSAVAGAPDAGAPRSARSTISALYAQSDGGDSGDDVDVDIDAMDRTVVARRRRISWMLVPPGGAPVEISSEVVILGRRPSPDPAYPGAQLVAIPDETRTVSKTHARLELRGDTWFVTDLGSTNGVLFATLMGTEVEAEPGQELEAGERFFLGDAEVRLRRSDA